MWFFFFFFWQKSKTDPLTFSVFHLWFLGIILFHNLAYKFMTSLHRSAISFHFPISTAFDIFTLIIWIKKVGLCNDLNINCSWSIASSLRQGFGSFNVSLFWFTLEIWVSMFLCFDFRGKGFSKKKKKDFRGRGTTSSFPLNVFFSFLFFFYRFFFFSFNFEIF